jgi:hypothetical protein
MPKFNKKTALLSIVFGFVVTVVLTNPSSVQRFFLGMVDINFDSSNIEFTDYDGSFSDVTEEYRAVIEENIEGESNMPIDCFDIEGNVINCPMPVTETAGFVCSNETQELMSCDDPRAEFKACMNFGGVSQCDNVPSASGLLCYSNIGDIVFCDGGEFVPIKAHCFDEKMNEVECPEGIFDDDALPKNIKFFKGDSPISVTEGEPFQLGIQGQRFEDRAIEMAAFLVNQELFDIESLSNTNGVMPEDIGLISAFNVTPDRDNYKLVIEGLDFSNSFFETFDDESKTCDEAPCGSPAEFTTQNYPFDKPKHLVVVSTDRALPEIDIRKLLKGPDDETDYNFQSSVVDPKKSLEKEFVVKEDSNLDLSINQKLSIDTIRNLNLKVKNEPTTYELYKGDIFKSDIVDDEATEDEIEDHFTTVSYYVHIIPLEVEKPEVNEFTTQPQASDDNEDDFFDYISFKQLVGDSEEVVLEFEDAALNLIEDAKQAMLSATDDPKAKTEIEHEFSNIVEGYETDAETLPVKVFQSTNSEPLTIYRDELHDFTFGTSNYREYAGLILDRSIDEVISPENPMIAAIVQSLENKVNDIDPDDEDATAILEGVADGVENVGFLGYGATQTEDSIIVPGRTATNNLLSLNSFTDYFTLHNTNVDKGTIVFAAWDFSPFEPVKAEYDPNAPSCPPEHATVCRSYVPTGETESKLEFKLRFYVIPVEFKDYVEPVDDVACSISISDSNILLGSETIDIDLEVQNVTDSHTYSVRVLDDNGAQVGTVPYNSSGSISWDGFITNSDDTSRGSYTLNFRVFDGQGIEQCSADAEYTASRRTSAPPPPAEPEGGFEFRGSSPVCNVDYLDVSIFDRDYQPIMFVTDMQIFSGHDPLPGEICPRFKPDDFLTRAEYSKISVLMYEMFNDVPRLQAYNINRDGNLGYVDVDFRNYQFQWFADYLKRGSLYGFLQGYRDSSFRPGNTIVWPELAKVSMLSLKVTTLDKLDFDKAPWYADVYTEALDSGLNVGNPSEPMKRRDAARFIYEIYTSGNWPVL